MPVQLTSPVLKLTTVGPEHPTAGLDGYPAHDWFAPAPCLAISPVAGVVTRHSGHDPAQGPVAGPHGPFGWSVYIDGDDGHSYYLTHLAHRVTVVGARLRRGEPIGVVAPWHLYGTPDHVHMGVRGG